MAKKNAPDSSDKKKQSSSAKKAGKPAKKTRVPAKKSSRGAASRDVEAYITLEELLAQRMLIEKSKKPLAYLLDKTEPNNQGQIWLCWPEGCISIDDIGGTGGFVVLIEKSKG